MTELILVIFRDGVEILEREKGSNDLERIERGAVCGENLMYGSVIEMGTVMLSSTRII